MLFSFTHIKGKILVFFFTIFSIITSTMQVACKSTCTQDKTVRIKFSYKFWVNLGENLHKTIIECNPSLKNEHIIRCIYEKIYCFYIYLFIWIWIYFFLSLTTKISTWRSSNYLLHYTCFFFNPLSLTRNKFQFNLFIWFFLPLPIFDS